MTPETIVLTVLTVLVSGLLSGILALCWLTAVNTLATRREITSVYTDWQQERRKATDAVIASIKKLMEEPLSCPPKKKSVKPKPRKRSKKT